MLKIKKPLIKRVKWGIAGCGRYAEMTLIPALHLARKNSLNAVFSHNQSRANEIAEKFDVPGSFSNYDEFLKSDINAVCVTSANIHHYEQVIKAAKTGKHIFCEKPIALTSVQAEEMVQTCKENKVQFAVGYIHRFHPLVKKARELIKSQILGKLVSINLSFNIEFPPGDNFRFNKKLSGGGALRDLGTHMIDLLRFLGGEIDDIQGVVDQIVYKSEVDDFSSGIVKFQKSGYGYFNVSYNNRNAFNRIEILGHKGALSIENLIGRKQHAPKLTILLEGEAKKSFRKRGNKAVYMIKSVQHSFLKHESPLASGYDGYINLKLMEELEDKCLKEKS